MVSKAKIIIFLLLKKNLHDLCFRIEICIFANHSDKHKATTFSPPIDESGHSDFMPETGLPGGNT